MERLNLLTGGVECEWVFDMASAARSPSHGGRSAKVEHVRPVQHAYDRFWGSFVRVHAKRFIGENNAGNVFGMGGLGVYTLPRDLLQRLERRVALL